MSKISAFFCTFIFTLFVCLTASATKPEPIGLIPIPTTASELSVINAVIVEVVQPPRHVLVETNKILRYQLRHKYTLNCLGDKYGALDFKLQATKVKTILLLSGQTIEVNKICSISKGDPVGSIYIYKRL